MIVWADRDPVVRRVLELVERKGVPVHVLGAPPKKLRRVKRDPEAPVRHGMLPD